MHNKLTTPRERAEHLRDYRDQDLNVLLMNMQKLGKPRVSCFNDGKWSCSLELFVTEAGASFEVRSDFEQLTPIAAAHMCVERVIATLSKM